MTASRTLQQAVGVAMLVMVGGLYWLIAKTCDLVSPHLKWFVIPAMLAVALLIFARSFVGGVKNFTLVQCRRTLIAASIPLRYLRHSGSSRTTQLSKKSSIGSVLLPASSGLQCGIATETQSTSRPTSTDLPYNAAVIIMPQRPFEPEEKIRAVYMRDAPAHDWLSVDS